MCFNIHTRRSITGQISCNFNLGYDCQAATTQTEHAKGSPFRKVSTLLDCDTIKHAHIQTGTFNLPYIAVVVCTNEDIHELSVVNVG